LTEVNFTNADLQNADLRNSNLFGAIFDSANLIGADFTRAFTGASGLS